MGEGTLSLWHLLCLCVIFWICTARCPNEHVSLLAKKAPIPAIWIILSDATAMVKHNCTPFTISHIRCPLAWGLLLGHHERVRFGSLLPTASSAIRRLGAGIYRCKLLLQSRIIHVLSEKIALRHGLLREASWLALSSMIRQRLYDISVGVWVH